MRVTYGRTREEGRAAALVTGLAVVDEEIEPIFALRLRDKFAVQALEAYLKAARGNLQVQEPTIRRIQQALQQAKHVRGTMGTHVPDCATETVKYLQPEEQGEFIEKLIDAAPLEPGVKLIVQSSTEEKTNEGKGRGRRKGQEGGRGKGGGGGQGQG